MKRKLATVILCSILASTLRAGAWEQSIFSAWAAEGIQQAYQTGAVSQDFDLGADYTKPITRAQMARLTVDLVAHTRNEDIVQMAARLGITLEPSPAPEEQTPDGEVSNGATADQAPDGEASDGATPDGAPDGEASDGATSDQAPDGEASDGATADQAPDGEASDGATPDQAPEDALPDGKTPHNAPLPAVISGSFADTDSIYVELAARLGIVTGADGLFLPHDPVTRAEAAAMMQRCMTALGFPEANRMPQQFTDAYAIPRWAIEPVKYISGRTTASGQAIMGGADGKFSPLDTYTIEEAILSIGRMQASLSVTEVAADWRTAPGYDTVTLALTFGGDCTLGRGQNFSYSRSFDEMYDQKGAAYFFSGISEFFDDDLTMVNFEGTLTNATRHADKTFAFKGRAEYAQVLDAGSIDVVTIANNHSMDYLQRGFDDTIRNLSPYVHISGYERMPVVTVKGIRVGFVSNVGWSFDAKQKRFIENAIASLRAQYADVIVFNYHWGIERDYRSNATQRAIARYCIDQGADLVIGHHPHVVQEVETYKGKQIAYSLGNLVFGGNSNPADKNCLIFRQNFTLDLNSRKIVNASYTAIPYRVSSVSSRNDYHPVKK